MVIEVDKAVKELRTPKINQVVKTKMIEDFQESSRLFQTQIIYVYSLFRTIGHQWSDFEESSVSFSPPPASYSSQSSSRKVSL